MYWYESGQLVYQVTETERTTEEGKDRTGLGGRRGTERESLQEKRGTGLRRKRGKGRDSQQEKKRTGQRED